jgi:ApaG protein
MHDCFYHSETHEIHVFVRPVFLKEESCPEEHQFLWAYTIEIRNNGNQRVQLLRRCWYIIDAQGQRHDVEGPGVVGQQPILDPRKSFTYTSGCPLNTPSGLMSGFYTFIREDGSSLQVLIPSFSLDSPFQEKHLH